MALEGIENITPDIAEARVALEEAQRTVADCANSAWNGIASNDVVSSSVASIQRAADDAWRACEPALAAAGETVCEGAKNGTYLGGRFALGVADVGENAYIGVRSNVELLIGDEEAAVETAQIHVVDDAADSWGDFMGVNDQIREIGDYAEAGGGIATEVALGAAAVTTAAPVAFATGSVLVLDEMGKSLESSAEDGEISQEDIAEEAVVGAATATTLFAGRGLNNLTKSKPASEVASAEAKGAESAVAADVQIQKTGGSYSGLRKSSLEFEEVHHMPADFVSPLERTDGPAIRMLKEDHRITASCGNSLEAREYRAAQQELIDQGRFMEAIQMDIDDIVEKFGSKYDEAIAEMLTYAAEKGYI